MPHPLTTPPRRTLNYGPELPDPYALLDRHEAAAMARVNVATLDRWIRGGLLPVVRIGARILLRRAAVVSYLAAHDPTPQPSPETSTELDRAALFTYSEAVHLLGVGRTTADRMTAEGWLPVMYLGRLRYVRAGALAELIDALSEPATTGPLAGRHA